VKLKTAVIRTTGGGGGSVPARVWEFGCSHSVTNWPLVVCTLYKYINVCVCVCVCAHEAKMVSGDPFFLVPVIKNKQTVATIKRQYPCSHCLAASVRLLINLHNNNNIITAVHVITYWLHTRHHSLDPGVLMAVKNILIKIANARDLRPNNAHIGCGSFLVVSDLGIL